MLPPAPSTVSPRLCGVLFDMDGTLIDSTENGNLCWSRWADEAGIADRSFQNDYFGKPARQILSEILPDDQIEAALTRIIELESTVTAGVTALRGAAELLTAVPQDRHAIVTSSVAAVAAARLSAAGLTSPDTLITGEMTPLGKPHPDPFLLGAASLGIAPGLIAVMEDTPAGIAAARAAGIGYIIAVEGTYPARALDADVVVPRLGAVSARYSQGSLWLEFSETCRRPS